MRLLAAFLLLVSMALAQGAEARRLHSEGAALAQKGEYPKAREKLQRALAILEKATVRSARMGSMSTLQWIAYCYEREKDWKNAVKYRREVLAQVRRQRLRVDGLRVLAFEAHEDGLVAAVSLAGVAERAEELEAQSRHRIEDLFELEPV